MNTTNLNLLTGFLDDLSLDEFDSVLEKKHTIFNSADVFNSKVKNKEDIEILQKEICYVSFVYDDGSVLVLHSTLNPSILAKYYSYVKDGFLFDIDRFKYFPVDGEDDCVEIKITKNNPYSDDEVIIFLNSFI